MSFTSLQFLSPAPERLTALFGQAHLDTSTTQAEGRGGDGSSTARPRVVPLDSTQRRRAVIYQRPKELFPGVWLTGPVPRKYPERNWSGSGLVTTPSGTTEDTVPEDMALVCDTDAGLVIVTGCGHAGVINILDYAQSIVRPARVHALIGGIHLFAAKDDTLNWTAGKMREFEVDNFLGGHCTGIETVYRFRRDLGLDRAHAVVSAVGANFQLGHGIDPGVIAK